MKIVYAALWLMLTSLVSAAEVEQINITQLQYNNLGVKLGNLQSVEKVPLLNAPARVVIPPDQEFIVSTSLTGLVSQLHVAVGDSVKQGDRLASINSPELLSLQQQFLKADTESRLAELTYKRDEKLLQEGVIADRRWQETRSRYFSLRSEVNEAKQLLQIAGMSTQDIKQLQQQRRLSSLLIMRSPITGAVLERMVVAGERLAVLEPIYRIANLDQLWLDISMPQEKVAQLKLGDQVLVENSNVQAKISLLGQSVNPKNQTVLVRAVIDELHRGKVRAGQTVNALIVQNSDHPVFKVPNGSLAQRRGKSFVFVNNENGFAVTPVTIFGKQDEQTVISGALSGQEQIVVRGAVALKAKWLGLGESE